MPTVHPKLLVTQGLGEEGIVRDTQLHQIGSEPYPPQSREEFNQTIQKALDLAFASE